MSKKRVTIRLTRDEIIALDLIEGDTLADKIKKIIANQTAPEIIAAAHHRAQDVGP